MSKVSKQDTMQVKQTQTFALLASCDTTGGSLKVVLRGVEWDDMVSDEPYDKP